MDKIFAWVMSILYNHPIIVSKKAFESIGKSCAEDVLAAACTKGLLEPGTPETIYLNPRTSFAEQKHSLFHEGMHLLLPSLDEEFIGQNVLKNAEDLENEIVAFEEHVWNCFSKKQKELFGVLIRERRAINPAVLPLPRRRRYG